MDVTGEKELHWPADEIKDVAAARKHPFAERLKGVLKFALFFVDEAIVLLILGYLAYRLFY